MDLQQSGDQSGDDQPYITVSRDERGSAVWVVVDGARRIEVSSGQQAMTICKALRKGRTMD